MRRKTFMKQAGLALVGLGAYPLLTQAQDVQEEPQMDKKIVEEFVRISHGKLDKVKEMLAEHPTLLNAAHDWRRGDFETGLGAASHVGHKVIVKYLLEQGAQANIFTAALLGKMEIVKPMLETFPSTLRAKGPHGFTLLHHANKGGDEALEVKEYLESLGLKETKFALY
ncbi:MAG: ankyrin repeat domain-containing protein [Saprospiraceae bacterium]|nr:ankyrin repeat domain-containing protein [Saprospiraceae bacterium]